MHVLITGAAGYLGSMLLDAFAADERITRITGVDVKPRPKERAGTSKLDWIQGCVSEQGWVDAAGCEAVEIVVHCAYQIRQPYDRHERALQDRSNIAGGTKVFEFALRHPTVRRLVTLSTVSAYGAAPENSVDAPFAESRPLRETDYVYGVQKADNESYLRDLFGELEPQKHVVILRLASVSGPRGRFGLNRFGLVSTIAGRFPALVAGRSDWGRQYLHEDDAIDAISMFVHLSPRCALETYNVAPFDYATLGQLAALLGKKAIVAPPSLLRAAFFVLWHGSRGAITTPRGAWKFLSYPIRADATRLAADYGFRARYSSADALLATSGRYATHTGVSSQRGSSPGEVSGGCDDFSTPAATPGG